MDQQQQQQSTVTAGDNSKAMWEYEAPQYCDFSSADTFVDTDPTVDKFFLTDHDSTKENDESMAASADGSSDADIFATPLTTRSGQKKSLGTSSSCYRTPKSSSAAAFDSEAATPVAPPVFLTGRLSTLRQTPLREIYNQGGKPLHEAGRRVSVFGKKSAKKAAAAANNKDNNHKDNHNNSRRETFDMGNVAEAIEEVSASVAASKEEEEEEKSSDKENHNGPPAAADELMSEEEEEAVKKSEETVVEAFHSVDAEKELSEEAAAASAAPSLADDSSALNSSRRSSYIVKSPSIRVVHFADESVRNSSNGGGLEALVEDSNEPQQQQTTPVAHNEGTSKSSLKIKARQLTPMVVKEEKGKKVTAGNIVSKTATTTKASTGSNKNPLSIQGLLRNRLSKKYIKRFSKSMEEEKAKEEEEAKKKKDEEKGQGPSSSAPGAAAPAAKPKSTVIGLTKKRVTIAAVPAKSATTTTTTSARTSTTTATTSGKRGLSLKGSTSAGRRFTTAASMLLRKKSLTSAAPKTPLKSGANNNKGDALSTGATGTTTTTTGPSRPSPYLGLSVLNAHFMSKYCRNYTPPTAAASSALKKQRPKATVPVSPNLHTSTRCTMRKAHTMPNVSAAAPKPAPVVVARKPLPAKPKVAQTTTAPAAAFVPTKAITPKFSTEARLKLWHVKHGDQADGGAAAPGGGKNGGGLLFKARPMPNFKRMQAAAAKQAAAAIEKGKHAVKPIHQEKK